MLTNTAIKKLRSGKKNYEIYPYAEQNQTDDMPWYEWYLFPYRHIISHPYRELIPEEVEILSSFESYSFRIYHLPYLEYRVEPEWIAWSDDPNHPKHIYCYIVDILVFVLPNIPYDSIIGYCIVLGCPLLNLYWMCICPKYNDYMLELWFKSMNYSQFFTCIIIPCMMVGFHFNITNAQWEIMWPIDYFNIPKGPNDDWTYSDCYVHFTVFLSPMYYWAIISYFLGYGLGKNNVRR